MSVVGGLEEGCKSRRCPPGGVTETGTLHSVVVVWKMLSFLFLGFIFLCFFAKFLREKAERRFSQESNQATQENGQFRKLDFFC